MNRRNSKKKIALFGTVKILVFASLLCALSGVLKLIAPSSDVLRISFENFPIVFSGIVLGPYVACAVGIVSDLLGCLFRGYAIMPLITLASMLIGFFAGITFKFFKTNTAVGVFVSTFVAHIIGNIIIKTFVLSDAFGMPLGVLFVERLGIYCVTAFLEATIIWILYKNKAIKNGLKRVIDDEL